MLLLLGCLLGCSPDCSPAMHAHMHMSTTVSGSAGLSQSDAVTQQPLHPCQLSHSCSMGVSRVVTRRATCVRASRAIAIAQCARSIAIFRLPPALGTSISAIRHGAAPSRVRTATRSVAGSKSSPSLVVRTHLQHLSELLATTARSFAHYSHVNGPSAPLARRGHPRHLHDPSCACNNGHVRPPC